MTARAMSKDEAFAELEHLQADGVILFEQGTTAHRVNLDGWNPATREKENGNVAGVVVRYLESGSRHVGSPSGGSAPDRLDPRNALALVRLCQWLGAHYGVTELYHLGIAGGGVDQHGNPRTDCHGQGRAVDFVGVRGTFSDGTEFVHTVLDDWGAVETASTPGGWWLDGTTETGYRLDDPNSDPNAAQFFRDLYGVIASEWQDRSTGPDPAGEPTAIGEHSFVMHPDHPTSSPGRPNGREAHRNHIHMQIGVTGTEH